MKVSFLGNFGVSYSTESHLAGSMELLGHEVTRLQEGDVPWPEIIDACRDADAFWWVQTLGLAERFPREERQRGIDTLNEMLPTVAQHLDLWHSLARAPQVAVEPFFRCQWVFTADGDHDAEFATAGVNHRWSPPAVYGPECVAGTPRRLFTSDVAFVGSWQHYGHEEWWPHRRAMLDALRRRYRGRVKFWPRGPAIRGQDLNDLYASARVIVGDSCLADRSRLYFSDRAFETVGRGGFLVTPWIQGLANLLEDGVHCRYFPPGDHDEMCRVIDYYLRHDAEREQIRRDGQAFVRANHTYSHRVASIFETVGLGAYPKVGS